MPLSLFALGWLLEMTKVRQPANRRLRLVPSNAFCALNHALFYCGPPDTVIARGLFASLVASKDARVSKTAKSYFDRSRGVALPQYNSSPC